MPKTIETVREVRKAVVPNISREEFPRSEYGDWEFIPVGNKFMEGPFIARVFTKPAPTGKVDHAGRAEWAQELLAATTNPVDAEEAERFVRENMKRTKVSTQKKGA